MSQSFFNLKTEQRWRDIYESKGLYVISQSYLCFFHLVDVFFSCQTGHCALTFELPMRAMPRDRRRLAPPERVYANALALCRRRTCLRVAPTWAPVSFVGQPFNCKGETMLCWKRIDRYTEAMMVLYNHIIFYDESLWLRKQHNESLRAKKHVSTNHLLKLGIESKGAYNKEVSA